jgi:hypothetical protein
MKHKPARLTISMFKSKTKAGQRIPLLTKMTKIMRSGHVEEPPSWRPMMEYATPRNHPHPTSSPILPSLQNTLAVAAGSVATVEGATQGERGG